METYVLPYELSRLTDDPGSYDPGNRELEFEAEDDETAKMLAENHKKRILEGNKSHFKVNFGTLFARRWIT